MFLFLHPSHTPALIFADITPARRQRLPFALRPKSRLLERSCLLLPLSNWSVLSVGKPISKGMIALESYVMDKGVSSVDFLGIVWYAHNTWGSSSTLVSSNLFFNPSTIILFVAFAWPLPWGYAGVEYLLFMPKSQQYLQKALLSNWSPLSDMRVFGTLNLVTMFSHTNLFMSWSWMLARGSASTHSVK